LGTALLVAGLLGLVAPYSAKLLGLVVAVRPIVEIVDHVIPGAVVLGVAGFILMTNQIPLPAGLLATLAAFWMTVTHLPLLAQAARGAVGWAAAWWHTGPGVVLLILSTIVVSVAWRTSPES